MHFRVVIVLALLFLLPFGAFSPWAAAERPSGDSSPAQAAPGPGDRDESKDSSQNTVDQDKTQLSLFLELLKSPSPRVRDRAANALGKLGDRRAVPALIEAPGDEDAGVREHVATALGLPGDKRAVQPLTDALQKEQNHVVQEHIISALKNLQ